MKPQTAFQSIRDAIVRKMMRKWRYLYPDAENVSCRVVRIAIANWKMAGFPYKKTPANEADIESRASGLKGIVSEKYRQEYGISVVLWIFLSPVISFAITQLLEWWFDDSTQLQMIDAIKEVQA